MGTAFFILLRQSNKDNEWATGSGRRGNHQVCLGTEIAWHA